MGVWGGGRQAEIEGEEKRVRRTKRSLRKADSTEDFGPRRPYQRRATVGD